MLTHSVSLIAFTLPLSRGRQAPTHQLHVQLRAWAQRTLAGAHAAPRGPQWQLVVCGLQD